MKILLNFELKKGENNVLEAKNIPATLEDSILEFELENMNHKINLSSALFTRENEEYCFTLDIENEKCGLELKKEGYTLDIHVDHASINRNQKEIRISYLIETDDEKMTIHLTWEESK